MRKGTHITAVNKLDSKLRKQFKREYQSWHNMTDRCTNQNSPNYQRYGERGISITPEWTGQGGFIRFLADLLEDHGPRPDGYSLDRRDNEQGYNRHNCRWASPVEQASNRRPSSMTRWLDFDGDRLSVGEFSRLIDRDPSTVLHHLKKGRTPEWIAAKAGFDVPALSKAA